MVMVAGVRFKKACKVYDFDSNNLEVKQGETVIVEVDRGLGMGTVAYEPVDKDPARLQHKLKRVIRKADSVDMERQSFNLERENEAFSICREKINELKLDMKLIKVEYLFDSSKAIFYFSSEGRIDFRELVKNLASSFHTRIEMRQVGVRDEAKIVGGIGPCGRELCCSNFLSNFAPVTVRMAKEQNLSLNTAKISGLCGRLMCCLSFEHDSYSGGKGCGKKRGRKGEPCGSEQEDGSTEKQSQDRAPQRDRGRGGVDGRKDTPALAEGSTRDDKRPERAPRRGRGRGGVGGRKDIPALTEGSRRDDKSQERTPGRGRRDETSNKEALPTDRPGKDGENRDASTSDSGTARPEGEKKGRGSRRSRRGRGRNRNRGARSGGGESQGQGEGQGSGSGGKGSDSSGGGGDA